jgi:hypothetical protein
MLTEKTPSPSEWEKAERRGLRRKRCCSRCGSELHTLQDCDKLAPEGG